MNTSLDTSTRIQTALQIAEDTALWISSFEHSTEAGLAWGLAAEKPETYVRNLYAGSAGIAVFLVELWRVTGREEYLAKAFACGDDLVAYVEAKDEQPCAMFSGWGGYAFALVELARVAEDGALKDKFETGACLALDKLKAQSSELGSGRGFIEPMPFSDITGMTGDREIYDASVGSAGAGMIYLNAAEARVYPDGIAFAKALGDRLIEVAEPMETGLQWRLMNDMPFPFTAPNFAHGGAGVAYFLARLYQHGADERYLDAAKAGARHLMEIAFGSGDGHLICHQKEGKHPDEHFYLGQCHGPAGTSRLYRLLHTITDDDAWLEFSDGLMRGLVATGAPETRSFGLWNNVSQCCCDAGIGDYALFTYRDTGDKNALDLALRIADELERRGVHDDKGYRWPQAEHRSRPDFIETQTGYMQGAAGVGSFFVHLATTLKGEPQKIVFADSPFGNLT